MYAITTGARQPITQQCSITTGARQPIMQQCSPGVGQKRVHAQLCTAACLLIEMCRWLACLINYALWLELGLAIGSGLGLELGYVRLALSAAVWLVSLLHTVARV